MQVIQGEALAVLREMPDNSADAIITDPPAGISFMGKDWDNPDYFPLRDKSKEAAKSGRDVANYGIGYARGKHIDNINYSRKGRDLFIRFLTEIFTEARRVLKPGGHALVWSLPRTSHWTGYALEEAGFEIRDTLEHLYGSGFPKSLDVSKAIDKMAGIKREVIGPGQYASRRPTPYQGGSTYQISKQERLTPTETAPTTPEAQQWTGFGSALKPAHETWWLCRKPLAEPTIAANVLRWGTGGLNIDGTRVNNSGPHGADGRTVMGGWNKYGSSHLASLPTQRTPRHDLGRFPSNFLLSHSLFCTEEQCFEGCAVLELDRQSGIRKSGAKINYKGQNVNRNVYSPAKRTKDEIYQASEGYVSRYFQNFYYCSKPSRREKQAGCDELPERQGFDKNTSKQIAHINHTTGETTYNEYMPSSSKNTHPTVKPVSLLSYFVRLITPPGGIVLDPFAGSGTTALAAIQEGCDFILIEREQEYVAIAEARIKHALAEIA